MYTKKDLIKDLHKMGLKHTDTIMVHSSMKAIGPVEGGADTVVDVFMEYFKDGLFMTPTHTWAQMSEEYSLFDPEEEPACVGIIPNIFRKREGVVRSLHPTHSIAAYGPRAEEYVKGEENVITPCQPGGCWSRLLDEDAKILMLGCTHIRNTFIHAVEELLDVPERLTEKPVDFQIKMPDGSIKEVSVHRHYNRMTAHISEEYDKLEQAYYDCGAAKKVKFGDADCILCDARKLYEVTKLLLSHEINCFIDRKEIPSEWWKEMVIPQEDEFQRIANQVSVVTIVGNVVLAVFKFIAGIMAHSAAMISDAVHSASDVFSTIIVLIGIRIASKEPDKEHPYGHERMECVAAIILAMVLFVTGLGIGVDAWKTIVSGDYGSLQTPGMLALVAAAISIITKEAMYWYTIIYARKIDSGALAADAWHHRSDALSSIGALIGIAGAMVGFPIMDSIASLVIFVFIAKAAYDIFKDAMDKMVDHSCDDETEQEIYDCVMRNAEVKGIDMLRTRIFGNKIYVDVEILVDGTYTLQKAHEIAEEVHDEIELSFPKVKHIMVHVHPAK